MEIIFLLLLLLIPIFVATKVVSLIWLRRNAQEFLLGYFEQPLYYGYFKNGINTTFYSFALFALIWFVPDFGQMLRKLIFNTSYVPKQEMAATLSISKAASIDTIESGNLFYYTLQYRCASLTEDCNGVMITDPLPAIVEFVSLAGSVHTINETYDPVTHTVTFEFIDPLPAGASGEVIINARFRIGVTPNNITATNTAQITADNAPTINSNSVDVTATAAFKWSLQKTLSGSSITLDEDYTYRVQLCKVGSYFGALNWTNLILTDTLPVGAVFVNATNGGVYDPVSHTVSWPSFDKLVYTSYSSYYCTRYYVTIRYPSMAFNAGDIVTNTISGTGTPIGEPDTTLVNYATHTIIDPIAAVNLSKDANVIESSSGSPIRFSFRVFNTGNVGLDSFCIIDTIPSEYNVTFLSTPFTNQPSGTFPVSVFYQTNLNPSWRGMPFNPTTNAISYPMSLVLGTGEYVTVVKWDYGTVPSGFSSSGAFPLRDAYMDVTVNSGVINGDVVTNCAYFMAENVDTVLNVIDCAPVTMVEPEPVVNLIKSDLNSGAYVPGDTIEFTLQLRNEPTATGPLVDPVLTDLLPDGLEYVDHTFTPPFPSIATVSVTPTPNFAGTGRELVQFDVSGSLDVSDVWHIRLYARVKVGTSAGQYSNTANFLDADNPSIDYYGCEIVSDTFDLDGDLDFIETFCSSSEDYIIQDVAVLESRKSVLGHLDTAYVSAPDFGHTVPSGVSDYKLEVWNASTVPITDIVLIDILPFVGDQGVIDLSDRNSRWSPYLVDTVAAPVGVTVYYSTIGNPCRSAEGLLPSGPPGCTAPAWSTSPPSDITTVQSLKFEFGSIVLNPLDTLTLTWPMRTPLNTLNTIGNPIDSLANNSFAYIGRRADNGVLLLPSEAQAIGINIQAYEPGVYGDFIWLDDNGNGLQDLGESGVNGVRVELYLDSNGDGISDPTTDSLINFTLTGDGGYYGFPELETGDYFSVAYLPSNYLPTIVDQGSDDNLDSDGSFNIIGSDTMLITTITNITNLEADLSWDFGLVTSGIICTLSPEINLSQNTACINEPLAISSSDLGVGATYSWDFGTNATPSTATGIGPHNVLFTSCGNKVIELTTTNSICPTQVIDSILTIIDNDAPIWTINPQNLIMECDPLANYSDSINVWLSNNGDGIITDNCNSIIVLNDYNALSPDCGHTANATVTFTAIDSCGNSTDQSAQIQIIDTNAPDISSVSDIIVDCESISGPATPTATDDCDDNPIIAYEEVIIQHPNALWKHSSSCTILYEITSGVYDDKGTASTSDDEMSFILTVIGKNTGTGWNATIGGIPTSGNYYESMRVNTFLSTGPVVSFTITDDVNPGCTTSVTVNAANF